jgi:hypothetical protein
VAAGGVVGTLPDRDVGVFVGRPPCCPVGLVVGVLVGRDDGGGVEVGGVLVGRDAPGVVGGLDVRLLPGVAAGWFDWLGVELFTVGVLDDRDVGPGVAERGVELLEPVVGALDVRDDLGVALGVAVLVELLGPRGVDLLSSPLPD